MAQENIPASREIDGSCHCGNIRFTFLWPDEGETIPVRACGCTFCRKHQGVWTSNPQATLSVRTADANKVDRYRFGTETAEFHICTVCGVVPVVTSEIAGVVYAVVNANCFDNVARGSLVQSSTDFDGEAVDDRLGRRERNWIPNVTVAAGTP